LLIGITGYARAGKDTFANELVVNHGFTRRGFADPLKEMALAIDPLVDIGEGTLKMLPMRLGQVIEMVGWEEAKAYPDVRRILQRLGKEAVRDHLGEDAWINALHRATYGIEDLVIPDVRFVNESDYVRSSGGVIWRIERDGVGGVDRHASENELMQIEPDLRIHNTTLAKIPSLVTEALGRSRDIGTSSRLYSRSAA
jgi:hypothetical protein